MYVWFVKHYWLGVRKSIWSVDLTAAKPKGRPRKTCMQPAKVKVTIDKQAGLTNAEYVNVYITELHYSCVLDLF